MRLSVARWLAVLTALAVVAATSPTQATLITGWGAETGFANGTVTDNGSGNITTASVTGNLGVRALLPSAISLPSVGSGIQLSGTVTIPNAIGNEQFRFGLFNTNGHNVGTLSSGAWTSADPSGWFGYIVEPGNGGGSTLLAGRNGSGSNAWLSTSGASYTINNNTTASSPPAGTYAFSLLISRTDATSTSVTYDFDNLGTGGSYQTTGTFADSGGLSAATAATSFNAVGFLLNGSTGAASFANVDVSPAVTIPEPCSIVLMGLGGVGLAWSLRKRR